MTQVQKTFIKGKVYEIDLSDLRIDESQPHRYIDEESLRELTSSILKHGVLQPILVRHADGGGFTIVSGERRYRAALRAGLASIPALIADGTGDDAAIVASLLRESETDPDADIFPRPGTHHYHVRELSKEMGKAETQEESRQTRKGSKRILLEISTQASHSRMKTLYAKFRVRGSGSDAKSRKRSRALQGVDINFVRRFTHRIDLLQVGSLDQEQAESLMADLEVLKSVLGTKLRTLKVQPQKE